MSLVIRLCSRAARSLIRARAFASVVALAAAVSACSGEASTSDSASLVGTSDGRGGAEPGWLVIDWTIGGDKDVERCDSSHSATIALTVSAASGEPQGIHQETCLAFNATITLAPGDYTAEAVLRDGANRDLTVPVTLQPFEISSGIPARIPLEFPASAFYAR